MICLVLRLVLEAAIACQQGLRQAKGLVGLVPMQPIIGFIQLGFVNGNPLVVGRCYISYSFRSDQDFYKTGKSEGVESSFMLIYNCTL